MGRLLYLVLDGTTERGCRKSRIARAQRLKARLTTPFAVCLKAHPDTNRAGTNRADTNRADANRADANCGDTNRADINRGFIPHWPNVVLLANGFIRLLRWFYSLAA